MCSRASVSAFSALALVVVRDHEAVDPQVLQSFLRDRVARFWVPEYWAFVRTLPKTSVGKIDKKELRLLHAAGSFDVRTVPR